MSKLFEAMINRRIVWLMESRGLISKYQAGFRKGYSTTDHLVYLESKIKQCFENNKHALAVFFDLEKAYDVTWRHGILKRLKEWGLRGNLPTVIRNFLQNRTFRVRVGDKLSRICHQTNGTPQGSVLSVTLFAIAINGIGDGIDECIDKTLYVDDLAFLIIGDDLDEMGRTMQANINKLEQEVELRGFSFSSNKTSCVHVCRLRKAHSEPTLRLGNENIPIKENIKFLGLTLDKKLY